MSAKIHSLRNREGAERVAREEELVQLLTAEIARKNESESATNSAAHQDTATSRATAASSAGAISSGSPSTTQDAKTTSCGTEIATGSSARTNIPPHTNVTTAKATQVAAKERQTREAIPEVAGAAVHSGSGKAAAAGISVASLFGEKGEARGTVADSLTYETADKVQSEVTSELPSKIEHESREELKSAANRQEKVPHEMDQEIARRFGRVPTDDSGKTPGASSGATQGSSSGISLLDLAEVLDQHKVWVESGGESGAKADLCGVNLSNADLTGLNLEGAFLHRANLCGADLSMASLRGANLVQADLRESNLLGTELRGANLMGANLYGAEGVWVGRLGGTNLFDAILPETVEAFDSTKAINDATKIARWFYFLTLSVSAICCLLVLFTTDARLVLNSAAIPALHLGNALPIMGFYLGAPMILFALYLRFHFLLLRLWGSMAALPAIFQDGQTLEKDGPWYLMGLVRKHFRWTRDARSTFAAMEMVVATALAYWIVPVTLFMFWLRYLVKQDFRGTLLHAVLLTLSITAATCVPALVARVLTPGDIWQKSKNLFLEGFATVRPALMFGAVVLLLSLGVMRGLPADADIAPERSTANPLRWAAQVFHQVGYRPYADLTEAMLSPAPKGSWSEEAVKGIEGAPLNQINLRFARAYRAFLVNARLWRANLRGVYLSEADLRGANMREVILEDAILDRAQLQRATLISSRGRAVNLVGADLRLADLSYGNFEGATLSNAKAGGAALYGVNLRGANMLRADLSRTDLRDTKMEGATLAFANLQEADLSSAKLSQANLTGAQLKSAILLDADLKNADLRGAFLGGSVLREAALDGANLDGADLRGAAGLTAGQLCGAVNWRGALLDADLQNAAQSRCAAQAAATTPGAPTQPVESTGTPSDAQAPTGKNAYGPQKQ